MTDNYRTWMPHYAALLAESERTGWPLAFRNDLLVHDLAFCQATSEGNPFLWVLRDSGTHVILPSAADDTFARQGWLIPSQLERAFGGCRFYAWDGRALIPLAGPDAASEFLRTEYLTNGGKA